MMNNAEERVSRFYNTVGWETEGEITEDARRWEDLRVHAKDYVSKCRLRLLRHIPEHGVNILDMASGPIQYIEYLEYSRNFQKRYCVDLSSKALEKAKSKIGDHGVFLHGSFFDIPLEEDFFDCTVSLHTIYHIDKDKQEDAVRKLIKVTKPGNPVIIVYSNPHTIISFPIRALRKIQRFLNRAKNDTRLENRFSIEQQSSLYFYPHPIEWWDRFSDTAYVQIFPWRSLGSNIQKRIIPNNKIGGIMFSLLFALEELFPVFFVKHFQYPMIKLTKRESQ